MEDGPNNPFEEAVEDAKRMQQQALAQQLLTYLREGNMPYEFYKGLPEGTKKAYRTKWKGLGKHQGHIKGRPMTKAEQDSYNNDRNKKKRQRKQAKASRKRNRK